MKWGRVWLLALFLITLSQTNIAAPWAYVNSNYTINVTFVPQNGDNITDIQLHVNLTSLGGAQQQCQDVNFTWLNRTNNIEYGIDSWMHYNSTGISCQFWAKTPVLYSAGINTTLIAYFNGTYQRNDTGAAALVGEAPSDDFEDGSISGKWQQYCAESLNSDTPSCTGTFTESGGYVQIASPEFFTPGNTNFSTYLIANSTHNASLLSPFWIHTELLTAVAGSFTHRWASGFYQQSPALRLVWQNQNPGLTRWNESGGLTINSSISNMSANISIYQNETTRFNFYHNGSLLDNFTKSSFSTRFFIGSFVESSSCGICAQDPATVVTKWNYVFSRKAPTNSTESQGPISSIVYSSRNSYPTDDTVPSFSQGVPSVNISYHRADRIFQINTTDSREADISGLRLFVNDSRFTLFDNGVSGSTHSFNFSVSFNTSLIAQILFINLTLNDTTGNKNSTLTNYTVFDGLVPFAENLTQSPPETSIALGQQNVTFFVDAADHNNASPISVLFEISGAIAATNVSGVFQSGNRYNLTYRPLALGVYTIYAWVNDSALNANKTLSISFETIIQSSGGGSSGGGSVSLPSAAIVPSNITMTTDKGSKTYSFVLAPSTNRKRLLVFRNFGRERNVQLECRSLTKNISLCSGVKFEKIEFTPKLGGLISTIEVEIAAPEIPGKYQLELLAKTYEENGAVAAVGVDMEVSSKGYLFEVLDFTFNQSLAGIPNFLIMMFVLLPLALLALATLTKRRKRGNLIKLGKF